MNARKEQSVITEAKKPFAKARAVKRLPARAAATFALEKTKPLSATNFSGVFRMDSLERIEMIKKGVPAGDVAKIARAIGRPKERLFRVLGLVRATVDRRARAKQRLPVDQGERVLGLSKLVGQVQLIVEQSGDPTGFDAAKWVADWLDRPAPALGGRCPADYMDTAEGQGLVSGLIARAQSGAYA
jgi:putative toxin-antitoxin system antitoxin component (TIGR02293 family)